ncbi:MAG: hypothetical protein A2770_02665 [Candidatus Levybacteria bacterium RIFCSPHIGHO2_01_FULL_38_12]|nr:MAG: hypothetical protein A2770_02665 [Candidatus Levybacteria bacterium RIFCSPHIGHO2_01_FULL_38_12]
MRLAWLKKIPKDTFAIILLLIPFLAIVITNYKPGTWLLGWDVVMPELNFKVSFIKLFHGAWQSFQGLGITPIMQKSTDLIGLSQMFILNKIFFVPVMDLRWVYTFAMLLIGTIGTYFLSKLFFSKIFTLPESTIRIGAILSSWFYLLNLGTVQNFYTPHETFTTFYGYLPLCLVWLYKYVDNKSKKDLLTWSILNVLLMPTFITITNFFVYLSILIAFALGILFSNIKNNIKPLSVLLFSFLIINSYWLSSFVYSTVSNSKNVLDSRTNEIVSEDVFWLNREMGTIKNVAILKGFWFQNVDYDAKSNISELMFSKWIFHLENQNLLLIAYINFGIILLGFISALYLSIFKKKIIVIGPILVFIGAVFMLINDNFPTAFIFNLIRENFDLFREAFRFPFTKFVIPAILSYSILLGLGFIYISSILKLYKAKIIHVFVLFALLISQVIFIFPVFQGQFIYDRLKVHMPKYYTESFEYLSGKNDMHKVVILPEPNYWGWYFTNWGFRGSGYVWYGIPQPVIARAFDPWSKYNEQFYNEIQYAIYNNDSNLLSFLIDKYNIGYFYFDKDVIVPYGARSLFHDQTKILMDSLGEKVTEVKDFGNITIYTVKPSENETEDIELPAIYQKNNPEYNFSYLDPSSLFASVATINHGEVNYIPFVDDKFSIEKIYNSTKLDLNISDNNALLYVPPYVQNTPVVPTKITVDEDSILKLEVISPKIVDSKSNVIWGIDSIIEQKVPGLLKNQSLLIDLNPVDLKNENYFLLKNDSLAYIVDTSSAEENSFDDKIYDAQVTDCAGDFGQSGKSYEKYPGSVKISASLNSVCLDFPGELNDDRNSLYKVEFEYLNSTNAKLSYCLLDLKSQNCINKKYYDSPLSSGEFKHYEDYVYVKGGVSKKFVLAVDSYDPYSENYATVKDIKLTRYDVTNLFGASPINEKLSEASTIDLSNAELPVFVDISELSVFDKVYLPGSNFFNPIAENCDNYNEISYGRKLEAIGNSYRYLYSAIDAISCDLIETKGVNPNSGYILNVDSQNVSGKRIEVCLGAQNNDRCVVRERLNEDVKSYLVPPYPLVDAYNLSILNSSAGNHATENYLNSVTFKYIPYTWLKSIFVTKSEQELLDTNGITISRANKKAIYKYEVSVEKVESDSTEYLDDGLIILNQSFENGWGLYEKDSCLLGITTSITCKKANADHVLAKNWANSWIVPSTSATYVIIFWPQYLQFLGYAILVIYIIGLALTVYKRKIKSEESPFYG